MRNYVIALPDSDRMILKDGGYIIRVGDMIGISLPIEAFYDPLGGKDRPEKPYPFDKEAGDIYER